MSLWAPPHTDVNVLFREEVGRAREGRWRGEERVMGRSAAMPPWEWRKRNR